MRTIGVLLKVKSCNQLDIQWQFKYVHNYSSIEDFAPVIAITIFSCALGWKPIDAALHVGWPAHEHPHTGRKLEKN